MSWLLSGILLWGLIHAIPIYAPVTRAQVITSVGVWPYKALFAIALLGTINMIVQGWIDCAPETLFMPNPTLFYATRILMLPVTILLVAGFLPTNLKRYIRHPQLTGIVLWGVAHLLSNQDLRSYLLFGGMIVWAILMIIGINKRDGAWEKPEKVSYFKDIILLIVSVLVCITLSITHIYFTGTYVTG